jgi:hypothetical protein
MTLISKGLASLAVIAVLSSPVSAQGIVLQKNITLELAQPSPMLRSRNAGAWDIKSR